MRALSHGFAVRRAGCGIPPCLIPACFRSEPGAAGGNQQIFGIGPGVVAAICIRVLGVKQIEEVVKVGDFTSASAFVDASSPVF